MAGAVPEPNGVEVTAITKLVQSLRIFSAVCLKIADKKGVKQQFIWNEAQEIVHGKLEQQLAETGKVRAIILKGRQQGISTYVAARFYHRTTTGLGKKAFIVGHEQKSTDSLFSMVKRYHENSPLPVSTGATNAKELVFDKLEGGYKLATAGSSDVGRGNTAQFAHLSEFGFWANAQSHMAGLGNTIADADGTEIIIESTANGLGNAFHLMWQEAEAGRGDYIPIFIPWFIQKEYRATLKPNFQLSDDDERYQQAYGLDMEQMQWRANKISTYGKGFEWLFDQEYPATPALAFQTSTQNPLIHPNEIMQAVNSGYRDIHGPLIIGVDPAEEGDDRTAIAFRRGRVCYRIEYHSKKKPMQVAGLIAQYWRDHEPDAIFIDKIGIGAGIFDRLLEMNIPVIGVHSGEQARDQELYHNKRAEMWWLMKEWIEEHPNRLPNDMGLVADLSAPQPDTSSNGRKLLESKKSMKKRGIRSPDGGDALALTFAEPIGMAVHIRKSPGSNGAATKAGY